MDRQPGGSRRPVRLQGERRFADLPSQPEGHRGVQLDRLSGAAFGRPDVHVRRPQVAERRLLD
jgi:hypothetical protein